MKQLVENPICLHFYGCSGCQLDLKENFPPIWQEVKDFFYSQNLQVDFHHRLAKGWRCRAKLAVRGTGQLPRIGLFKEGSHDVIAIPACQVHHPHINQAVALINAFITKHGLKPYQEETGHGDLRYLQFVVERGTGRVQASFILNFNSLENPTCQRWKVLIEQLGKEHPSFWHSLWINLNDKRTNTIFGSSWQLVYGEKWLWENIQNRSVCFHPASFAQANLDLFECLLQKMRSQIKENSRIVEFYAGIGVIGFSLASKSQWVRCAEINANAEECFKYARKQLSADEANKISFHTGHADHLLMLLDDADTVIVDPPRKGLDPLLRQRLIEHNSVQQLIYVSCGWEAFKKDCKILLEHGWRVEQVDSYWFFPGSNHIELLVNFKKR